MLGVMDRTIALLGLMTSLVAGLTATAVAAVPVGTIIEVILLAQLSLGAVAFVAATPIAAVDVRPRSWAMAKARPAVLLLLIVVGPIVTSMSGAVVVPTATAKWTLLLLSSELLSSLKILAELTFAELPRAQLRTYGFAGLFGCWADVILRSGKLEGLEELLLIRLSLLSLELPGVSTL